jgi:Bacterial Ig-like domain (group 3)
MGDATTYLSTSQNRSRYGSDITITASVSGVSGISPTGWVTFKDGGMTLGSGEIFDGVTSITTASLSTGTHTITGVYGGDDKYKVSTSSTLYQTVTKVSANQPDYLDQSISVWFGANTEGHRKSGSNRHCDIQRWL